ncbi:copper resistance CopC family protein [Dactylosporangium sp. CA-092794]|uniref:copper resistance CopC family protein n=1 Tax=Dactylosporangium sp. CA-092794 TaxID=3239929 RepID=UPI003D8D3888
MSLPVRVAVVLVAAALVVLPATPAAAHGQLALSDPVQDSTVSQPMSDISLYFTETPPSFAWFTLTTPSGRRVDNGWRTGQPKRLDKPVQEYYIVNGKLEPRTYGTGYPALISVSHWPEQGLYVAAYQSVASDGDQVKGTLRFTYTGPVTQPPSGWTPPTNGPSAELTRALSGASPTPGLLQDAGSAPAQSAAAPPAPFVLTDWLIPAVIVAGVAAIVLAAARRAPARPAKKRRRSAGSPG